MLAGLRVALAAQDPLSGVAAQLKAGAEVSGEFVRLGEIADLSGPAEKSLDRLRSLIVGRAPLLNSERSFSQADIRLALRRYGLSPEALKFSGPERVSIRRGARVISREEIREIVTEHLRARLPWKPEQIKSLEVSLPEGEVSLPAGELSYEVGGLREPVRSGIFSLPVTLKVDGERRKRIWVKALVRATQSVVVTRVALERGRIIAPEDLAVEERAAEGMPRDALIDPEEAVGKRVRQALGTDAILRSSLLELPILVKRGSPVIILVETPRLRISAPGEALQKGTKGEVIRVLNRTSRKEVLGRVRDANTVQVDF